MAPEWGVLRKGLNHSLPAVPTYLPPGAGPVLAQQKG